MDNYELNLEVQANITSVGAIETNMEQVKNQAIKIKDFYESLVINEDDVKDIKKIMSNLNKLKDSVSTHRKNIITEFKKPIESFESIAKETEKILTEARSSLDIQVKKYEEETLKQKYEELSVYFEEYRKSLNIDDFISLEKSEININLSTSIKQLKEQIKQYVEKVKNDLDLIDTQDNKAEILVEYKKTLNVSNSIMTVKARIEAEKLEREKQEMFARTKLEQQKQVETIDEVINEVHVPKEVTETKIYSTSFKVYGTVEQIKKLQEYLKGENLKYESI